MQNPHLLTPVGLLLAEEGGNDATGVGVGVGVGVGERNERVGKKEIILVRLES